MSAQPSFRHITGALALALLLSAAVCAQNEPLELGKIVPNDPGDNGFGDAIAVSTDHLIVGAPFDDDNGLDAGAAYIFDAHTGQQLHKLFPSTPAARSRFGRVVEIHGPLAIVCEDVYGPGTDTGAAYVFDVATGQELYKLLGNDTVSGHNFGNDVALDDRFAVVTAVGRDDPAIPGRGSAYVFDLMTGQQLHLLENPTLFQVTFGFSTDIEEGLIVVASSSSRLFLFDAVTGQSVGEASGDQYNARLDQDRVVTSDPGGPYGFPGTVSLTDLSSGSNNFLQASDLVSGDLYGLGLDLRGRTVLVSSNNDDDVATNSGSVYLFDAHTEEELFKITASDPVQNGSFGRSLALQPSPSGEPKFAFISAWQTSNTMGAVYVFQLFDAFPPGKVQNLHSLSHTPNVWSNAVSTIMEWTPAIDEQSGIGGYSVVFNHTPNPTIPEQVVIEDGAKTTYSRALASTFRGYYFHIRPVDGAGNWGETVTAGPFFVDREPPRQGKMTIASGASSTPSLLVDLTGISAKDQFMSGVDRIQLSNDGATWAPEEPLAQTRPGWDLSAFGGDANEGTKTVSIRFIDRAGNVSPVYTDTIEYRLAPAIDDITPAKGSFAGGNTIVVKGRSFTQDSTVTIDGASGTVTWVSFDELQVVVPPGTVESPGTGSPRRLASDVDVVVSTPNGSDTRTNGYRYLFVK